MSLIIHTYRHLSRPLCSYSRTFCKKVFLSFCLICYWQVVLSCGKMYLLPPRKRGVVQTQSPKYMYMYHLIYPAWSFSVCSPLHKTHLNLFFPVIMKTLVPHFLHTGGPYTTFPKYFLFFFVTRASPNFNVPDCCIFKPLAFILPSKYSAGYKNLISEPWTRRLLEGVGESHQLTTFVFYYEVFYY